MTIPYFGNISISVANILKKHTYISFQTKNSLQKQLNNARNNSPSNSKSGVYKLQCNNCSAKYIGQTGRKLETRVKEHIAAWHNKTKQSHFANHLHETNHTFNSQTNTTILEIENRYYQRLKLEQLHISHSLKNHEVLLNDQTNFSPSPLLEIALNSFS